MRVPSPLCFFLLVFLLIPACCWNAHAQAEYNPLVYEEFRVEVALKQDGSAVFTVHATLRNDGRVPVVPGYGVLAINCYRQRRLLMLPLPGAEEGAPEVKILRAEDVTRGTKIEAVPIEENESISIRYTLWQPLRPGQRVEFELSFEIADVVASGILFNEFSAAVGPFSSRIESGFVRVVPQPGARVVYASPSPSSHSDTISWDLSGVSEGESFTFWVETSVLPLPLLPVKGYILVWSLLLLVLICLTTSRVLRRETRAGRTKRLRR